MARIIVSIEIPEVDKSEIESNPDWIEGDKVVVDEAFLTRHEDDSFFIFDLVEVRDK